MVTKKSLRHSLQFNKMELAEEPSNDIPVPLARANTPIGSFGTISYDGYLSEEYLYTLRGRARADVFDRMRRSDPQVKMCLSSVKNPLKSANWEIEAFDEADAESVADAELIEHILFNDMDNTWVDFIGEALSLIEFGHSIFEPIHKVVLDHKKFGSYNGIKALAFRSQRTIERWNVDSSTGDLKSISQYAFGDLDRSVEIPADKLLIFTLDKEGGNYEGISALRPCYGPWFRKENYLRINAVGIEKFAVPTPLIKVPEGKAKTKEYDNMIQAVNYYTSHMSNHLAYPAGWEVTMSVNSYDPTKVENSIDYEDKRMVKAFLANFLELGGAGATGSYSLSTDLSDFFLSGIDHIASKISGVLNRHLIPQLIIMNKGQRENYPKLKHSGITDKAGRELAEVLNQLGSSRFIIPDDGTEEHLRNRYGLPKASEEGRRPAMSPPGFPPAPGTPPQDPQNLDNNNQGKQEDPTTVNQLAEKILMAEARRMRKLDAE